LLLRKQFLLTVADHVLAMFHYRKTIMGCCKGPDCTHWDEIAPETNTDQNETSDKPASNEQLRQQQEQQQQQ